ncbi:sugar dehydrogenase complex small subunit [Frateuria aurantia]
MSKNKIDLKMDVEGLPAEPGRRRVLLGLATAAAVAEFSALAATSPATTLTAAATPAVPADVLDRFMHLSRLMTARADISSETGARIYQAMVSADASVATRFEQLFSLQAPGQSASELLAAARAPSLDGLLHSLVEAWYTGTVGQGPGAVVVAYAEALMYRTVSDGLIVPTYGSYGPLWWNGNPPPLGLPTTTEHTKVQA